MDIEKRHKEIMESFADFTDGVRVLFLIHRHREGGTTNNTKAEKMVTQNSEEFSKRLKQLLELKYNSPIPYRIYSSVNDRDTVKAIRKFRFEQLESESFGMEQYHDFYFDIKNRWIGCLMQPGQRMSKRFLIDVDDNAKLPLLHRELSKIGVEIFKEYPTKQGTHIITAPFNPGLVNIEDVSVQKDALLLLDF